MSSASVRVCKRQQVCLPALVAASVEPLLLGSPGPLQVDAPAWMPTLVLPTAPELVPPPFTWSSPACPWVQYCLCGHCQRCDNREGYPSLTAPSTQSLSSSTCDVVSHNVLGAEDCLLPYYDLACSQFGLLW